MRFPVPSEGEGAVGLGPTCMFSSVSLLTELRTQPPFRGRNFGIGIFQSRNPGTRDNVTKTVIGLHLYEIPIELSSLMNLSVTMGLLLH